jgi:hypothetical protein
MNTIKFLTSHPTTTDTLVKDIAALRTKLFNAGIYWTDDVKGNFSKGSFRAVLYVGNSQAVDFKNPMAKECNGLVVSYDNGWKILAMPPPAFCTNKISMKKLDDLYQAGAYEVYEALDASIVTLYFYKDKWRMSSTKGYDIGDIDMIDGMTYMDAFVDLMETKYHAFQFDNLVKTNSYTVALRHSRYHIFNETKHLANRTKNIPKAGVDMNSYIMMMCVADTNKIQFVSKQVAGLPQQMPITQSGASIHVLNNYAKSAYAKYAKACRLKNFKYKPLYGYILRAKQRCVPDEYSTIYIESQLFKAIKMGLYKNNQHLRSEDYNRLAIQMSTNHEYYEKFVTLFAQFDVRFKLLDATIDEIAGMVIQQVVSGSTPDTGSLEIVDELVAQFKNSPDATIGVIRDAMYSKQYSDHLIQLFD